jgi:hypothetical protein
MSKIALTPSATGTGVFTISSPATNTNRTLTLPDEAGTIITTAGVPSSAMPAGSVLQVVSGELGYYVVTSSSSYSDIGLSTTITPTSTSSKILVCLNLLAGNTTGGSENYIQILRGATVIRIHERWIFSGAGYTGVYGAVMFEDSPSSTSALVYKVQYKTNTGAFRVNDYTDNTNINKSNLTLMEIAG